MSFLRDQKALQKKYYQGQQTDELQTTDNRPKPKPPGKKPARKGPAASAKDIQAYNDLVAEDIASYKGLPVEEKIRIKTGLIKRYRQHVEWVLETGQKEDSLAVNGYIIWLFDTGDMEGFLDTIDRAIAIAQRQTIIPGKDYQTLKLYWIMDWAAAQRDQGQSYEPYFIRVFKSIRDWKLPKKIREGYWYFMFYSLLDAGNLEEAAKIGKSAIGYGAEIKTNLLLVEKILAGKVEKRWDSEQRRFING
ncbi:hypothetical protein KKI24_24420 [bacterium]|nr:hypothetical protein [bacterium]